MHRKFENEIELPNIPKIIKSTKKRVSNGQKDWELDTRVKLVPDRWSFNGWKYIVNEPTKA